MYIDIVPNRNSPPCVLLRESYRVEGQVRKRTLLNISHWPPQLIENFRALLKGGIAVSSLEECFDIVRSRAHGHVAAVLGTLRRLKVEPLLAPRPCRERDLVVAMIAARILQPSSKLALSRELGKWSASTTLGERLDVESASEEELYAALDWLGERQASIENQLARKHLSNGVLVLYDITSTYFEGRTCPLARYGHSRDGKKDKLQIVFGLLCTGEGIPVAVEVFEGNTKDSMTVANQIQKIRQRFSLDRVVFVGDRGMLTEARLREDVRSVEGLDWITALTAPQVRKLAEEQAFSPSLFDEQDLAEIQSPDYPGERLVLCYNPFLEGKRAQTRKELLNAAEKELAKISAAAQRAKRPLRGQDRIGVRVGKALGRFKMGKHFEYTITENSFTYKRNEERIQQEARWDGLYIIRTSVPKERLASENVVESYKQLSTVERAFRSMKSVDLKVRPIHHYLEGRVRAHIFLCMLAYYVEWHMRDVWRELMFTDEDQAAKLVRDPVAPAKRSDAAMKKVLTRTLDDGSPVHSFQTLMAQLQAMVRNTCRTPGSAADAPTFEIITTPNQTQKRALDLINQIKP